MLYTPGIFRARWSLMGQIRLESFLGGSPIVLILCFDRTLLMQLKVISTNGKNATEVWSSCGGGALVGGLRPWRICFSL
jgi:hypothetical protein